MLTEAQLHLLYAVRRVGLLAARGWHQGELPLDLGGVAAQLQFGVGPAPAARQRSRSRWWPPRPWAMGSVGSVSAQRSGR